MISTSSKLNSYAACIISLFVLTTMAILPFVAGAQNSQSLSVSPTLFDMSANPGQTWPSGIRVINPNPYELVVYPQIVNFQPQGESGQPRFIPISQTSADGSSLAEWIEIPFERIVIPPEQTREVPLNIHVPVDAQPGGHFAAVFIGTKPPENSGGRNMVETAQIVTSLIFLRVSGDVVESGSIRSFRATPRILERPETTFELRFENTGNVHLLPQGEIRIVNMWNQERGVIPVNRETLFGNVLPDSVRKFSFTWSGEWSMSDIGRYRAIATLAYGSEGRQSVSSEFAFWVVPWKLMLIIFGSIFGFVWFMVWSIKLYVRRMLTLAGVRPEGRRSHREPITTRGRQVTVATPIEEGILDLSERLSTAHTWRERFMQLTHFLAAYRIFFIAILLVVFFVAAVSWFFQGASVDKRSFEVTVEQAGSEVTITSEELEYDALQEPAEIGATTTARLEVPPLKLVNQSGKSGLAAALRHSLEEAGYEVAELTTDFGAREHNTVIVYAPEYAEEALALSQHIEGALLSSFAEASGTDLPITVYVGQSYENEVE